MATLRTLGNFLSDRSIKLANETNRAGLPLEEDLEHPMSPTRGAAFGNTLWLGDCEVNRQAYSEHGDLE